MAKKKRKAPKPLPYWPGLTKLHDNRVGCGAVLLTDDLAKAVITAIDIATVVIQEGDVAAGTTDKWTLGRLEMARRILDWTFMEDE
jgi:hypothetical protein